jgi:hypothetical protein
MIENLVKYMILKGDEKYTRNRVPNQYICIDWDDFLIFFFYSTGIFRVRRD